MRLHSKALLAACLLAVTAGVAPLGAADDPQSATDASSDNVKGRLLRFKQDAPLHYELHRKHYNHALAIMPTVRNLDKLDAVYGLTALGLAASDESADAIDVVKPLLVTYGADPGVVDSQGFTALHYAARAGNYAVVELLLQFGADADAENPLSKEQRITPLYMAYQRNRVRIADLLVKHGAKELDEDIMQNLNVSAAVSEASEAVLQGDDRGDPQAAMKTRFAAMSHAMERTLREQGRLAELDSWQQVKDQVFRALAGSPRITGESKSDYMRRLSENVQRAISNEQGDIRK